jgi:hypothetical protein
LWLRATSSVSSGHYRSTDYLATRSDELVAQSH